jgi:hypothetical protein
VTFTAVELAIHRLGTKSFIDADSRMITLTPRSSSMVNGTKVSTPQTPRDPQKLKVIFPNSSGIRNDPSLYRDVGSEGASKRFDFVIIGEYDAQIAVGDFWKEGQQEYQVEYVFPDNGYEVKAGGISYGASPR